MSDSTKHMDSLVTHFGPAGENWIFVTLHEVVEQKARSTKTVLEVRVDGVAAGALSAAMSADLLPVVRHLDERGLTVAAKAVLKGNRLKADIAVAVCRGSEVPDAWLARLPAAFPDRRPDPGPGAEVATTGTSTAAEVPVVAGPAASLAPAWRFSAPPGWPVPPPGWFPQPGWRKPPAWPDAPTGWQFWHPVQP